MKYKKEILEELVRESKSYSEVTRKLGLKTFAGNRKTIKKYIELYSINVDHFTGFANNSERKRYKLNEILIQNSPYDYTTHLKDRLYREGLKERCCELCGQNEEWQGKKMSLILDHKNGVNNDNRIENLRIVCPNCNATLSTHGGKNVNHDKTDVTCDCGKTKTKGSVMCLMCNGIKKRKVIRPDINQIQNDVEILGYVKTGEKYGVSDNAIRKWLNSQSPRFDS